MKVVLDTNVIVSALINENGPPAKILSLALNGKIKLMYDNRILSEYADVLSREHFGFNADAVDDLMDYFKYEGEYVDADYLNVQFTDESDKKFYEVCKSGKAQYLITGNAKHFPADSVVISPNEFWTIANTQTGKI